ncbi:MAG: Hsp20/alpha crystallin family protein [Actinomycetota bacterium]|nr:Hsp20/alpha crystallin family protein [Actinomycetota bacterium]
MLMRFDPFRELDRLASQAVGAGSRAPVMAMDAYRRGDQFVVHFDVPGVDPSSIDLTVEKNVLTVSAERQWQPQEGDQVVVSERPQGRFSRQVFLGEALDADRIEASCADGVLTLRVPVAEQAKPRKVEVTSGGGSAQPIETNAQAT